MGGKRGCDWGGGKFLWDEEQKQCFPLANKLERRVFDLEPELFKK